MSLPSGYTPLEYIKSSGTQYINTGFNPNQNTRVVVDAKPLSVTQAKTWCIFGVRTGAFFELYKASTNNMRLTFLYGSTYTQGFNSLDYTKRHTFEINKNTATVDGTTLTYSVQTFQQTYPLFLLADDNNGKAEGIAAAELYSAKVYDNGTLIRDFIPCKNASGVIGLWDDVNSVFYKNAGSGTFDAGELPKAHKVCINGIGYSVTKVTVLIDGTERKAKKGRVLIDGTAYDVLFAEETVTITVHNGLEVRNCYVLYNGQRITSGEIDVKIGDTVVVYVGAIKQNYGVIYLNSAEVVKGINVQYEYPVTKNATISYSWVNNIASECYIVEE